MLSAPPASPSQNIIIWFPQHQHVYLNIHKLKDVVLFKHLLSAFYELSCTSLDGAIVIPQVIIHTWTTEIIVSTMKIFKYLRFMILWSQKVHVSKSLLPLL